MDRFDARKKMVADSTRRACSAVKPHKLMVPRSDAPAA
jgi:hypothetical protein